MSSALDQGARTALERFVQRARRLLEEDLAREAEGRFGIHVAGGAVEDEDGLHLDPSGLDARRDVVEILDFLRREEPTGAEAVGRLIREASFTHLNRLTAIRIAEAIQLLPESLARGPASTGFKEILEAAPLLAHDASGGYWRYLQLCGDELAADLPQLFDPRNPLLELAPSSAAFDDLVEMIGAADLDPVWAAPDALGWAYQFFNSGDERRAMRDASASPRNSRELAVRNQFFTPRYVVDFLVHNSLGRRLLEADPTSGLADQLPMLLDPPTEPGVPLALTEVRVLDPACGSGHFLLGAYDVLERAWELQGVLPEDAAPNIVSSLWGIDIDARCAQVAAAAVILRARRFCKAHDLPVPNIITARALPEPAEGWDALLASLPPDRRQLVVSIRDALDSAPVLGPLLKVEELLATEIRSRVVGADEDPSTLFGVAGIADDAFGRAETDVLQVLQGVADRSTSGPADRLFAAEAQDAIRFVDAMRHRYDAVLMNPPFGDPVADTKDYLKTAYSWLPTQDCNLEGAFSGRGVELAAQDGAVGVVAPRSGLFLTSFRSWRGDVALGRLSCLADLGHGVMAGALVEACAYVMRSPRVSTRLATFIRLLRDSDRESGLIAAVESARAEMPDRRVFRVSSDFFERLPGSPFCYWIASEVAQLFVDLPTLEGSIAEIRGGGWPGDDFRRVRLRWEVAADRVGRHEGWVPYSKGGDYSPFWSDIPLVVAWDDERRTFRDFYGRKGRPSSAPENVDYYFRAGLTAPRRTTSGFSPRVLPSGSVFSDKSPAFFAAENDHLLLLGWLTSRVCQATLQSLVAAGEETTSGSSAKSYEVGLLQSLPWPGKRFEAEDRDHIALKMGSCIDLRRSLDQFDEMTVSFVAPHTGRPSALAEVASTRLEHVENIVIAMVDNHFDTEEILHDRLELGPASTAYLDGELGAHPASYPKRDGLGRDSTFVRWYSQPLDRTIQEVVQGIGGSRAIVNKTFIADRFLEVLSHALESDVGSVVAARRESRMMPDGHLEKVSADVFSYLVGLAFGRWDATSAGMKPMEDSALAETLFGERRGQSPGMLRASGSESLPLDYPISIPWEGLLLDEPGHQWDIEASLFKSADAVFGASAQLVTEVLGILGSASVRAHLRSKFFKEHLSRYSGNRRKAPIYWPLTVGSGQWGVWAYAPHLSREMLYVVASEALRREGHAHSEMERLEREEAKGGAGRGAKEVAKALDAERKLAEELRRFREEAERIAGLGWEPDLDDGIVLCAAPLADLFPMWKEPAQYRKELRSGKYEWSTVSKWADQL